MARPGSQHQTLTLLIAVATLGTSIYVAPSVQAEGFIDDSKLTGAIYYWQRERDRKDMDPASKDYKKYTTNLSHSTFNTQLDFSSGYAADWFGIDLGGYAAWKVASSSKGHPDEISFSTGGNTWGENWKGDKSGFSYYKAAIKLKAGDYWLRAGYLQPTGQTLLASHWSFLPGTYRGAEAGALFDYGSAGELSFSYMWADQYKAPWYQHISRLRQADKKTRVRYVHSIGAKYDFKNDLLLEAAAGQSQGFINQYFAKASYKFPIADNKLRTSYQFYGAEDRVSRNSDSSVYDSLAWLQALTFGYGIDPFDFRLEGTWVKAEGKQGFFLQRMTTTYGSSNGRLDIWWDNRSDFNANGEKAIFAGVTYDLKNWQLPGWKLGTSYVYGWDAKPNSSFIDQKRRVNESAVSFDIGYTIQEGKAKDTAFKLHLTRYNNHFTGPDLGDSHGNMFPDEKDVKFIVTAPFTLF